MPVTQFWLHLEQEIFNFFTRTRHIHLWDLVCLCVDDKSSPSESEL